ncbi:type VI secretion system-associated FHA domain protein TagH [Pseudoduganella aquatica]|uniref:type VI secretion system-associated FHA domain protein TagH n=1 Tax=Pseudoduganella aquatica TaxID=2660641 RepID=UPI001E3831B6|nr:type VI secretion system-associated FHA domain protein TagH [Pseudoduganella aquatica]
MYLTLRIQSYRKQAPAAPVERRFDQLGGTIGRAAGNDLELPDPGKYISRNHSKIDFAGGQYTLMDLGANPSWINDRPVGTGKSAVLADGDRLLIGDYVLEVQVGEGAAAPAIPVFQPETSDALPFQAQPAVAASPYEGKSFDEMRDTLAGVKILELSGGHDPLATPSANDPLGLNMLSDANAAQAAAPVAFRGSEADHAPPQWMPMAQPQPQPPAPEPVPQWASPAYGAPAQPYAHAPEPTVLTVRAAPQPPAPAAPAPAMLIPDDYDPLADFLPPRVQAPAAPYVPQPAAPIAYALPPQQSHAAPGGAAAQVGAAQGGEEVIQALLRGLGLTGLRTTKSPAETAELVGAMLREATSGTMAVLMARAMTKRESRLEMTVLGAQANNPLKFFPDAESALSQMLTNTLSGYMPPVKSIGSAFEDLKAHELAVIAGMRAALDGVLARFNPALIEAKEPEGVMDKMMATTRKARLWDRMVALHEDILREADDDFQHLFGEKFSAAYEDQIGRLHRK